MTHVFHREPRNHYPRAVDGQGPWLIDADGNRYLDASGGAAVSCLGHGHPAVIEAIQAQLGRLAYSHSGFFTSDPMENLATHLASRAPGDLDRVYFVSGGSEAVEAALKLARQYHVERGESQRSCFIARRQSYHGNTLGALAVGGNAWRRAPFAPLLAEVSHVSPCYAYRDQRPGESATDYVERLARELEAEILRLGVDRVIAFFAEPVVGATLGAVPALPGYFLKVREICDRYGVLMILDEVMCGMGRTGTLFACEQEGVVPDIVCVAKGLAGGYQPIGAVIASARIYDAIQAGSGAFQHGHTYTGHTLACAAALAVQQTIERDGLLERVRTMGSRLDDALRARFGEHPHVGDIRGRGLFFGLEMVADRATKRPFAPQAKLHAAIKREAMARGLMCYPMGGTIDGRQGDHVLLAPPYIIEDSHLELIVTRLAASIDAAIERIDTARGSNHDAAVLDPA
ncbi:MAG: aspartate aminotransferase family protein [Burkholderiaceae bacterium]|nr:aspartate aminotransferase family protein [Burkholderiaceae bacterium]